MDHFFFFFAVLGSRKFSLYQSIVANTHVYSSLWGLVIIFLQPKKNHCITGKKVIISLQIKWKESQKQQLLAIYNSLFTPRYFPFPHPTSATKEPLGKAFKNSTMCGQGVCLVLLKCPAISSYTWWTYFCSNCEASLSLSGNDGGGSFIWLSQTKG